MIFNNPTDRPASYSQATENGSSNLVRLVEDPDVVKSIRFDEMSIEGPAHSIDIQGGNSKIGELGLSFPLIRINDLILARKNIFGMTISLAEFVPKIRLNLTFDDTTFITKNMPKDGDMVSLFLRVDSDAVQYLRDDFIITSCTPSTSSFGGTATKITICGKLFIPGFESKKITTAFSGTSKDALKQLATSYGIGFSFNDYDDTEDFQTWIRCNESAEVFIKNVTSHSWKNETSFFKSWIDLYYDLCFVNVNKFLMSSENNEEVDITFATNALNMYNQLNEDTSKEASKLTVKILTNATEFKGTPFFINNWTPVNNSTSVSMNVGYMTTTYSYLHNQNIINDDDSNCFSRLEIIPTYDKSKTDSNIILRGRAKYEKGKNPDSEQARVNYDFVNTYNNDTWVGIEYVLSDSDNKKSGNERSGNVHKNYTIAPYHNNQNINELNKMYLRVTCDGLNLQIMKGERVPVYLIHASSLEGGKYNSFSDNDYPTEVNRFYTGYYIVDSVEYSYSPIKGNETTPYKTIFTLKRREWPTPEQI